MKILSLILLAISLFVLSACTSTENGATIERGTLFGADETPLSVSTNV